MGRWAGGVEPGLSGCVGMEKEFLNSQMEFRGGKRNVGPSAVKNVVAKVAKVPRAGR